MSRPRLVCPVCAPAAVTVPVRQYGGRPAALAVIDAADAELVASYDWRMDSKGYALASVKLACGKWTVVMLHRLILGLEHGDPREGDHIHGVPLDCRRSNLRVVTQAQNTQNVHGGRGSSGHRGVSWATAQQRWRAFAQVDGRFYHLGYFTDELAAARTASDFRARHMPFSSDAWERKAASVDAA